jgi:hypothetical protein
MQPFRSKDEMISVLAVRWERINFSEIDALARRGGAEVVITATGRLLIAHQNFPFWLDDGEWLTLTIGSDELDAYGNSTFCKCFEAVVTAAVTP